MAGSVVRAASGPPLWRLESSQAVNAGIHYGRNVPAPAEDDTRSVPETGDLGEVVNERVFDWIVVALGGLVAWAVLRHRRRYG
jgi:hypothetical protein